MEKKKQNNPGLLRKIIGKPSSWILPFHAIQSAYDGVVSSIVFFPRFMASFFNSVFSRHGATRSIRLGAFVWPGPLGVFFCGMSIFYAWSGYWLYSAIFLVALIALCFLRVDLDGRP
jgi:hypothetical protein